MDEGRSPEQMLAECRIDFPDDKTTRISHEAIDHALFVRGGSVTPRPVGRSRTGRVSRMTQSAYARARQDRRLPRS